MATSDPDLDEAFDTELGVLHRGIPADQLLKFEGYAAEIFRAFGMDLDTPPVDFPSLARSMAVDATTVDSAGDVGDAVKQALDTGRPHLLELAIRP